MRINNCEFHRAPLDRPEHKYHSKNHTRFMKPLENLFEFCNFRWRMKNIYQNIIFVFELNIKLYWLLHRHTSTERNRDTRESSWLHVRDLWQWLASIGFELNCDWWQSDFHISFWKTGVHDRNDLTDGCAPFHCRHCDRTSYNLKFIRSKSTRNSPEIDIAECIFSRVLSRVDMPS